MTFVKNYTP
jgi:NUMOD3 motif